MVHNATHAVGKPEPGPGLSHELSNGGLDGFFKDAMSAAALAAGANANTPEGLSKVSHKLYTVYPVPYLVYLVPYV